MECLQSLAARLAKVQHKVQTQLSKPERDPLALGTSTFSGHKHTDATNIRRYFRYYPRKRPPTTSCKRSSCKNAVQIMSKLDRLVQLHVTNIEGRALAASPTAMQVLRFVTLVDATGREHPILMQCCTLFEQLQAMVKMVMRCKARDAQVQRPDDVVEAAWNNGLGDHALIWFGFTGGNQWKSRRHSLFKSLTKNPKAKFVTRGVQFGPEPLFDDVLPHDQLAKQVRLAKKRLAGVQIPVTVSELAYGYQERGGAQDVLDAIDFINIHILPFFSTKATTGANAWPLVQADMNWFIQRGNGKKMYFDENGWPSVTSQGVQPNSKHAVASVESEREYYQMLDDHCQDLKNAPGGGVGQFAHVYSDDQEPGYGIYGTNGKLKFEFEFKPRTSC